MDGQPPAGESTVDRSSLAMRLSAVGERVPPPQIADVWLFPPLSDVESSAEFLLFTRIVDSDVRALYSARLVPANGQPTHQIIVEHGRVPADRVPRLVGRLQRRLRQDEPPRHVSIGGRLDDWLTLVETARGEPEPPQV